VRRGREGKGRKWKGGRGNGRERGKGLTPQKKNPGTATGGYTMSKL